MKYLLLKNSLAIILLALLSFPLKNSAAVKGRCYVPSFCLGPSSETECATCLQTFGSWRDPKTGNCLTSCPPAAGTSFLAPNNCYPPSGSTFMNWNGCDVYPQNLQL